jgi:acyl carrier protein
VNIKEHIRSEISRLSMMPAEDIKNDTPLFKMNVLDSLSFLELITSLETGFHVKIEPKHLNERYFGTVDAVESLIVMLISESESSPQ